MNYEDALKPSSGEDWHAHVLADLARLDELIGDAKARITQQAAHMARLEKEVPELHAVSRGLQRNLGDGLRLLMHRRDNLMRELAYIESRKNVAKVRLNAHRMPST